MKLRNIIAGLFTLCLLAGAGTLRGQTYVKLNGLYALGGIINPAVEFTLSPHSTFQTELVISPWKSIQSKGVGRPMLYGGLQNEYRYYLREHNSGWYGGLNAGIGILHMTKFYIFRNEFQNKAAKGYDIMAAGVIGYEWRFGKRKQWLLDAYLSFGYIRTYYNGYALVDGVSVGGVVYNKGEVIMTPNGIDPSRPADPWNISAEWLPYKIGVSIGFMINDPTKRKK